MNEQKAPEKIIIATLDPWNRGGILTFMKTAYEIVSSVGQEPRLLYNKTASLRGEKEKHDFRKIFCGNQPAILEETFEGMRGFAIERILPEFEFFNYILNLRSWKKLCASADRFIAVGGDAQCALPFVFLKKDYILWVATTAWEDRIVRVFHGGFLRQCRGIASLPILLLLEIIAIRKAKKVLAISEYTKGKIAKRFKIADDKIEVAPIPVDTKLLIPAPDKKINSHPHLLFAGRINDPRKNFKLLLRSFALALKEFPDIKLKISGQKPNACVLKFADDLAIKKSVDFLGELPYHQLVKTYQSSALFLIPSLQEGLCISGLEAMSCGVPVASTRCGGPEDFVIDGENGFLVENNNFLEFGRAITRYFKLPEWRKNEMSEKARERVLNRYSRAETKKKLLNAFYEIS